MNLFEKLKGAGVVKDDDLGEEDESCWFHFKDPDGYKLEAYFE